MKILLIYNPNSGDRSFKNNIDDIIESVQSKGYILTPYRIASSKSLEEFVASTKINSFNRVWIAGGDGTIHQVINLLLENDCSIPIGIYPAGTANDFARYFSYPNTVEEITQILIRDNYTYCDAGVANNRYFINVASFGFICDISQKTNRKDISKLGVMAYYLKGIGEFSNLKPINVSINSKELTKDVEIYFMLIMNGKSAGGFKKIAPLASLSDGLLDIYIFKKCNAMELISLIIKVSNGDHAESPYVDYFQTSEITIECSEEVGTDMDGEKGFEFPLHVSVAARKLKILTRNNQEGGYTDKQSNNFRDMRKAAESISNGLINEVKRPFKEALIDRNTVNDLLVVASDMQRHNSLNYVNKNTLSEKYFEIVEKSLDNGYMYIILSSTGSAAGELIQKVTKKDYGHVSIAFDEELETTVSYNGGENIYEPGLNHEDPKSFNHKENANSLVYKIKANNTQKQSILNEIQKINYEGSSYNILGLLVPYSHRENIMFCAQFVYCMLKIAGLGYFEKKPEEVKPTDFVELDYKRKLDYQKQILNN